MDKRLKELLEIAVSSDRFAYDYTGRWRFLCLTPDEHKELCDFVEADYPEIKFNNKKPKKKKKK